MNAWKSSMGPALTLVAALVCGLAAGDTTTLAQSDDDPGSRQDATAPTDPAPRTDRAVPLDLDAIAGKAARHPNEPYILNEYANQLIQKGRLARARAVYERALKINPNFAIAWNNLGVAYQALGSHKKAVMAYRRAIKLVPTYAMAYYNLGVTYDAEGHYDRAIRSYERAFDLNPDLLDVRHNPQVASNRHLPAILTQWYVDRGAAVLFPVESAYPK